MSERPAEIIHRPNRLSAKVGKVSLDPSRLKKAQAVVAALSADYLPRLAEEARAIAARWKESARDPADLNHLHRLAHDIKGQGTTFGYPLATAIAGALCRLFTSEALGQPAARAVVDAHIAALLAVATEPIAGEGGALGATLLDGLKRTREKLGLDA